MDFVSPFVSVIDTYLIAPISGRVKYLRSSKENLNGLQTVVQDLKARRNDEQSSLKASENAGQVETNVASNWFKAVQEIELEADVIEKEYNEGTCAGGWCVNCFSLYKLSKRSVDLKLKADHRLIEQFVVARVSSPKPVIEMPTEPIIENQPSAQRMLKQMLDCIGDPDPRLGIIGVYGMGGVGKTTLARAVNNHFEKNSCFETVIMVTVSSTPNIPSIQSSIGKRLRLTDNNDADALSEALKKKKFLLILDDMWCKLKLEDVGIPHPTRSNKGSKILVTSRSKDVSTDMGARKTIKVQPLSEDESWELFVEVAGEDVGADGIKCFAEKLIGRCKGLPLAIVTVGHAMANRHGVGEWANAVREMELSATNLRAVKNKGEALIGSFKIACMLEDGELKGCVRMHDVMRELALWITSSVSDSNPKLLIRTGETFKEAPQAHEWVDATRISVMDTQIRELPELGEKCQKLTTMLLRNNYNLTAIPPTNFWQHMDNLSVLDLFQLEKLEYLPDSLSCLVNLRVLRLHMCKRLRALPLPVLGMLRQLQILDLGWCSELDQQILGGSECERGVSNLRYLDVKFSKVSIPAGVISGLYNLEELRFYASNKIKWRVNSGEEDEKMDGSESTSGESIIDVRELSCLTYLTTLSISFEDIIISDWFKPLANKIVDLSLNHCTVEKQDALEALNLDKSQILWQLIIEDCPGLSCVHIASVLTVIRNCEDLEVLLDRQDVYPNQYFLHALHLEGLPKLRRTWVSIEPGNCFGRLSLIVIEKCNSLKMVFTEEMPCLFNNLKEIRVGYCVRLEVLIEAEEEKEKEEEEEIGEELEGISKINGGIISLFPRLEVLKLEDLPMLSGVCTDHMLHCPLIREVKVSNCPRLKKDPLGIRNKDGPLVIEGEQWRRGNKVMEEEIQGSQ
ncbi:probable disease resistance protein At4g14610 [Macadamia integrifolia]|uniref:probable disease resistance protein At4g14610 n=1 Tax=Macadamia integrifolia TaxID=60698 RepID=UPI001C4F0D59|nr:probable disease resistance protein At4g14610 [Macadamia integrifolia]